MDHDHDFVWALVNSLVVVVALIFLSLTRVIKFFHIGQSLNISPMTTENPFVEEFQFQRENSLWCIDLAEARTDVPVQPSRSRLVRERSGGGDLSSQPALVVDQQTKRKKKNNSRTFTLTGEIVRPTDKDILFGRGRR
jgi:hypothetical protein